MALNYSYDKIILLQVQHSLPHLPNEFVICMATAWKGQVHAHTAMQCLYLCSIYCRIFFQSVREFCTL